jgi:hypothetical protein
MDYQSLKQELTIKKILFAAVFGIIMGLALQGVIFFFQRSKYMPVLFILFALIFILSEIFWLERSRLNV